MEESACGRILHGCHRDYMDSTYIARATSEVKDAQGHAIIYTWVGAMYAMGLRLGAVLVTVATSAMSRRVDTMNTICRMCGPATSGVGRSLFMRAPMTSVSATFPIAPRRGTRVHASAVPSSGVWGIVAALQSGHGRLVDSATRHQSDTPESRARPASSATAESDLLQP